MTKKTIVLAHYHIFYSFSGCSTLSQLQATLEHQPLYIELLQDDHPHAGPGRQISEQFE